MATKQQAVAAIEALKEQVKATMALVGSVSRQDAEMAFLAKNSANMLFMWLYRWETGDRTAVAGENVVKDGEEQEEPVVG